MGIFDAKIWNSEVFNKYLETVPRLKQNALLEAGILRNRGDLKARLVDQVGGNYVTEPIVGRIGGSVQNYDGSTNISANDGIDTYSRSMIVAGRAKGWREYDFTEDITGKNFMEEIAKQVAEYWDDVDEADLLAILNGIFGVTTDNFSTDHTLDITAATKSVVGPETLNNAVQKASGASKNQFTLVIIHSQVATNLENQQLLEYLKYTDANGVQRNLPLANWNGRTVLIDDELVDMSGSDPVYTTYILGANAFDYCDCGVKVPNETYRDPHTNGGVEELITRQRKLFAPKGFSFVTTNILSPTASDFATAANWDLAASTTTGVHYPTKAIPIARIKSLG